MKPILVTYATMAGSTAEVARAVAESLARAGLAVDVRPVLEVEDVTRYAAVVVGGPMIMGWHRQARAFLRRHRAALAGVPLAVFALAVSLTETGERVVEGLPVVVDPALPKPPAQPGRLSFRERYAQVGRYAGPILRAARPARPVSVALFGGRLALGELPWWAMLFVGLIIQAPAGDRRNWPAIEAWAEQLAPRLEPGVRQTATAPQ